MSKSCSFRHAFKRWRNDKFEWDIPTNDEGNLVLYVHTFASSLEPTKLANEDPVLQSETKITVSQSPNEHTVEMGNTEDPYPWLDSDDPR